MWRHVAVTLSVILALAVSLGAQAEFKAGLAKVDITPQKPVPMWGYGDRHDALSKGTLDPLFAKALVIQAEGRKLALVGLDMGRSPTEAMMGRIRKAVKHASGVDYVMIVGSHTHYGPVIELLDREGGGKGKFDDAVAYAIEFERKVTDVIKQAASNLQDVKIGWGAREVPYNRNRHWKGPDPKPQDKELAVIRLDEMSGKPFAVIVNFAAHPTSLSPAQCLFSAEYPGHMMNAVEAQMGCACIFMQGASGDLSTNKQGHDSIDAFGKALATEALEVAESIETTVPEKPSIAGIDDHFTFESRLDLTDPIIQEMFKQAFFPELMVMLDEFGKEIPARLTTVVLNGQLALVGGSGEFFCAHSTRLKAQSPAEKTLFFGYCNGHHMYFPTIAATEQGGYGAGPEVSWVAVGAGEKMIDKALENIAKLVKKPVKN